MTQTLTNRDSLVQHIETKASLLAKADNRRSRATSKALTYLANFLRQLDFNDPLAQRIHLLPDFEFGEDVEYRLGRVGSDGKGYGEEQARSDLDDVLDAIDAGVVEHLATRAVSYVDNICIEGPLSATELLPDYVEDLVMIFVLLSGGRGWQLKLRMAEALKEWSDRWKLEGVGDARGEGASWADIAKSLGVTTQAVHGRYRTMPFGGGD